MQRARKRIRYVGTSRARSGLKEGGPRRQVRANREAPCAISLGSPSLALSFSFPPSPPLLFSLSFSVPFQFSPSHSLDTFVSSLVFISSSPLPLSLSPSPSHRPASHPVPHGLSFSVRQIASSSLSTVNLFKRDSTPSMRIQDPSRIRCAVSRRSDSPHTQFEIEKRATTPTLILQSLTLIDRPRSHPTAPTLHSMTKIRSEEFF